ncbi:MAG TPA: hypothetical protein V6D04_08590 [Candidatus Obscuribacterales bacterium]
MPPERQQTTSGSGLKPSIESYLTGIKEFIAGMTLRKFHNYDTNYNPKV